MKRIKGFTILEMMLVLALAGIFLLLSSQLLAMVQKTTGNGKDQLEEASRLITLHGILKHEITLSEDATLSGHSLLLTRKNGGMTRYEFSNGTLERQDKERITSFPGRVIRVEGFFYSIPVEEGRIDHLVLSLAYERETVRFVFDKIYSAEQLRKNHGHEL